MLQGADLVRSSAVHLDWTVPVGTIVLVAGQFIAGVVGIMRAFAAIERSIDTRFNEMSLKLNTFKEGDIRDLGSRLKRLEDGADKWTEMLRDRTHDHAEKLNALAMKVDRLERPERYHRRNDSAEDV